MNSPLFTIKETAEYLRLSEPVVYGLVKIKEFPSVKVGGAWRIFSDKLQPWLETLYDNKDE